MHAISELVARQYLWGAIRLWSVFLLAAAVNISAIPLAAWDASRPDKIAPMRR